MKGELGVRILDIRTGDSRVDEGYDTPELLGGGQGGIAADVGDISSEGVEILLGGDELRRRGLGEITTELAPAGEYYYAEDEHQQYLHKNPRGYCNHGFCQVSYA